MPQARRKKHGGRLTPRIAKRRLCWPLLCRQRTSALLGIGKGNCGRCLTAPTALCQTGALFMETCPVCVCLCHGRRFASAADDAMQNAYLRILFVDETLRAPRRGHEPAAAPTSRVLSFVANCWGPRDCLPSIVDYSRYGFDRFPVPGKSATFFLESESLNFGR